MTDYNVNRLPNESKFKHLVRLSVAKLNGDYSVDWLDLVDMFGLDYSAETLRKKSYGWRDYLENEITESEQEIKYKEETEILKDGSQKSDKLLKMSVENSKDPNYLLKAHGYDPKKWTIVSAKSSIWNQHNKQDGTLTLYSSKITVKPLGNEMSIDEIKEFFTDLAKNYRSPIHQPTNYSKNGKMLELNIADLHLGKLCWPGDSNDTYNEQIARQRFFHIINDVLTRSKQYKFEKILFVFSNDFFHFDNESKTTTGGTNQDTNLQYTQLYKLGVSMLVEAIDLISQFAPVETFYIGSNHDKLTSFFAIENLNSWYRNNDNVIIDSDPKIRKYVEWGKCLIGFSHGHAEKKRLGKVMPIEAKEAWGRTEFHEIHAGHFHTEQVVKEENGTIVRYLPSVTGTDKWHYESGYIGAIKKAQSFIWDKENGLLDILNVNIK